MGAIVGMYRRDGAPTAAEDLGGMLAALEYRGLDGRRSWRRGSVGMGALLLAATPAARRHQVPLLEPDGGLAIAADARLDNRQELAEALGFDRRNADIPGDAALILAAYRRWGEAAPGRLLGDFAFAVWDATRQRFFCARDHVGVKQLYYYCSARLFAFATEIKALLTLPGVPARLNETRLGDLLTFHLDDPAATLYREIFRLPAASSLTVSKSASASSVYWRLDPHREIRLRNDADYADAYRELLRRAVEARLPASGPVGAALSGGLDSSAITGLARDILVARGDERLHTLSLVYDDIPAADERRYIDKVVAQGDIIAHYVRADLCGPLSDIDGDTWQEDEPLWSEHAPATWALYKAAAQHGIRIFLNGTMGNDVVGSGSDYMAELMRRGRWLRLARESRWLGRRLGQPTHQIIARIARQALPDPLRQAARRLRDGAVLGYPPLPLQPDFVARTGLAARWRGPSSLEAPRTGSHRQSQWLRLTSNIYPAVGSALMDRLAARAGIEVRHPFLDRRLVEFCLALPGHQKIHHGWQRWIARQAMAGILPDEIRWRAVNSNLLPAFIAGLLNKDRAALEEIMLRDPGPIGEYVDMRAMGTVYRRFITAPDAQDASQLWRVASLGLWLHRRARVGSANIAPKPAIVG